MKITKNNRTAGELRQCNGYKATVTGEYNFDGFISISTENNIHITSVDGRNGINFNNRSPDDMNIPYTIEIDIPTTPVFTDDIGEEIHYGEIVEVLVEDKRTKRILLGKIDVLREPYICVSEAYEKEYKEGSAVCMYNRERCRKIKIEEKKERKLYMTDKEYKLFCEKNDLDCK